MSLPAAPDSRLRNVSHSLRAELRERYIAAGGYDRVSYKQLDWMERVIRYLSRVQRRSGDRILRSIPQMAKGLGLDVEGLTVRQVRDRYENGITNTLGYLEVAGYVDHVERDLRHANGEGIGIVVVLPAGVAQSVRASGYRRTDVRSARRPACSSLAPRFAPPRRGRSEDPSVVGEREGEEMAVARPRAIGSRDLSAWQAPVRAALEAAAAEGTGEEGPNGAMLLERRPWLAEAPVQVVVREAWRAAGHRDGRISLVQAAVIERASSQLERCGYGTCRPGPAASRAAAIDLAFGDWRQDWREGRKGPAEPITAGFVAFCLGRRGRKAVAERRSRRSPERARRSHDWRFRRRSEGRANG